MISYEEDSFTETDELLSSFHNTIEVSGNTHGLSIDKNETKTSDDINNQHNTPVPYILAGGILYIHVFSYMIVMYSLDQYAYTVFGRGNTSKTFVEKFCAVNASNELKMEENRVQNTTARWIIYISVGAGVPGIFATTLISFLSDKFGRQKLLYIPLFGTLIKNGLCILAVYYNWDMNLFIIFYAVEGCGGTWTATSALCFSYCADVTLPGNKRTFALAMFGLCIGLGSLSGTLASGYIIDSQGYIWPLNISVIVSILHLCSILYLPEPQNQEIRLKTRRSKIMDILEFCNDCKTSTSTNFRKGESKVLIISYFFIVLASAGKTDIEILFPLKSPFCWDPEAISQFGTVRILIQEITGVVMIKIFQRCLSSNFIAMVAQISSIGYYVLFGLANRSLDLYLAIITGCLSVVPVSMIRAMLSNMTPTHQQGVVFAIISFCDNICLMGGRIANSAIYELAIYVHRGFVFFVLAGYNFIALLLLLTLFIASIRRRSSGFEKLAGLVTEKVITENK